MAKLTLEKLQAMTMDKLVAHCIRKLRKEPYKGVHSVYGKLNLAIKAVHPDCDPIAEINALTERPDKPFGKRPVKGGVIVYLPEDAQNFANTSVERQATKTLERILD